MFRESETNNRAAAEGHAVIHGGSLSSGQWENVRKAAAFRLVDALPRAGLRASSLAPGRVPSEGAQNPRTHSAG